MFCYVPGDSRNVNTCYCYAVWLRVECLILGLLTIFLPKLYFSAPQTLMAGREVRDDLDSNT